jgi:hypothetical protein
MNADESSVLLTHWDPDIYVPQVATPWLQELFLYSLLFGRVVVRDVDIFQNPHISRQLATSKEDFEVFTELAKNRCIEILTLPPCDYKDIETKPSVAPFTARAERHSKSRSFKGERWQPEDWQRALCLRLDAALKSVPMRHMADFPPGNDFATRLARTLSGSPIKSIPWFSEISDDAKSTFIELCADDIRWENFLRGRGKKSIVGEGQGFYRTAAYQCAKEFPESERAIRNLVQSANAWCECSREGTEGRYGGRLLWEAPYSYVSDIQEQEAADSYVNIQIVPRRPRRPIPIVPGIGEVLAATRGSPAFQNLQDKWAGIGRPEISEGQFWIAYEQLVEALAENAASKLVPSGGHRTWQLIGIGIILAGHIFGFSAVPSSLTGEGIALLGPELSRFVRSVAFIQKVKRELEQAVEIRCNKFS